MSHRESVVEPSPAPARRTGEEELAYRLRQQAVVADFGLRAIQARDLDVLLAEAARLCADGMQARFCKILEHRPQENRLFMRAGIGWGPGIVGRTFFAVDEQSPAGYAFLTGEPVVSNQLSTESRFRTPHILAEHGVKRASNVLIVAGAAGPWGVLAVDSPDEGRFDAADTAFMQSFAHLLGAAIERLRTQDALQESELLVRALFQATPSPYLVLTPDFTVEAANDAFLRETMTRREDLVGRSMFDAFPANPADASANGLAALRASLERVLATGSPDHMPILRHDIPAPGGGFEPRWWLTVNLPVMGDRRVRHILHHTQNVTDLVEHRRRAAAGVEVADSFGALIENAPQKMWLIRLDGSIAHLNAALRAYIGRPGPQVGLSWIDAVHPDDRQGVLASRASALANRRPYSAEFRLRRHDGVYRWHAVQVAPVFESGGLNGWLGVALDVEDTRRVEAEAHAAREEEHLILQSATDYAVITTDPEGRITFWSPGAALIFGYGAEEVLGHAADVIFTPEDRAEEVPNREFEAARRGLVSPERRWFLRKDGGRVFMNGSVRALRGVSGEIRGLMFIGRDETEPWRTSEELRTSEARYRAILDTAVDAVVTIDESRTIRAVNRAAERMFGWRADELVGGPVERLMRPEEAAAHPGHVNAYLRTGMKKVIGIGREVEAVRKDGTTFPVELSVGEWRDAEGRRFFTGFMRDITDRKRIEEALRRSEERFRGLADTLPKLVWIADSAGEAYWFNKRWSEYLGLPREAVHARRREFIHPDHLQRVLARHAEAVAAGEPWEDTFPIRDKDGRYRWFLTRVHPMRDEAGAVVQWYGASTDITERVEAEQLQRMLGQEISHRVKNNLALVSSLLQLQARELEGGPRAALEEASYRVHTVSRVHDQLWRQVDVQEIELAPFLSDLCAAMGATAPMITTRVELEPVTVRADDAVPIGLVVNELITNAYKYAYGPGEAGEVRVIGAWAGDGRYRLEVCDFGRGLPEGFDLNRSGASLGTRVIAALSKQLHAEVTAENTHPGARFTLTLPIERVEPRRG